MTGETENSDFYGIVLNAAVAAMDGCPWIEKGRVLQIADGIAETVTDRVAQVDSFLLPNGQRYIDDVDALIEASSLGTASAKAFRESVSDEEAQHIVDRVNASPPKTSGVGEVPGSTQPKEGGVMDYYEMRENALGWQKRAYRAEAELAELRAKPRGGVSAADMCTAHEMASRSSWWDAPQHWVLCTCGELIKGDSMESTAQAWRCHGQRQRPRREMDWLRLRIHHAVFCRAQWMSMKDGSKACSSSDCGVWRDPMWACHLRNRLRSLK